jgi:hypothetical protein
MAEGRVPNGTLTGYAISMALNQTDHTYVTSDAGHAWKCFGRAKGGTPICAGVDNVDQADCLSKPRSGAGVRYGRTGLCFQAANRILYPSGKTVSAARGYQWFMFAYGTYGMDLRTFRYFSPQLNPWPELALCTGRAHP